MNPPLPDTAVDTLLNGFAPALGRDFPAYRNHVQRVLHFFRALSPSDAPLPDAVLIAAVFHDLGIWTDATFDYLRPSVVQAERWLAAQERAALTPEVSAIILQHHKIRPYTAEFSENVERFRRADLVDLSLGLLPASLSRDVVRDVRAAFPNAGFHWKLVVLTVRQVFRTPWRPLPMFRW